jgi:two-component system, chemotaxis family, protein-glutamate methylesterase/glutaminase
MPKLRVLIVDDSVVVRRILSDALKSEPDLEVVLAANGRIALAKIPQVNPDAVTLDIEMPEMDGLTALKELRQTYPKLPVIMFSTLTERGAAATLDALAAGANDYVTKPSNVGSVAVALSRIKSELVPKIKALCGIHELPAGLPAPAKPPPRPAERQTPVEVVAIGVSTGGPNALSDMLPHLPRDLPVPIVIVQHMPPIFTKLLADRLAAQCAIGVKEGAPEMLLRPGQAIVAAGGCHMVVRRDGTRVVVATNMEPPQNSCRPSVDVLFRSVASVFGSGILGVILTGMGNDGLRGCEQIRERGGRIFVQDEASSVVWGMPGFVAQAGLADKVLPLNQIAGEIVRCVNQRRQLAPVALTG